jgi:hypothetical protein
MVIKCHKEENSISKKSTPLRGFTKVCKPIEESSQPRITVDDGISANSMNRNHLAFSVWPFHSIMRQLSVT